MAEIQLDWEDFVQQYNDKKIRAWVDPKKGEALLQAGALPSRWRVSIKIKKGIAVFLLPAAIILFFLMKWWFPVLLLVLWGIVKQAIKEEAAQAVIQTALEQPMFYSRQVQSQTLKLYQRK